MRENWIAIAFTKGLIFVYNPETLKLIHRFTAHENELCYLVVHPSYPYLLSSSEDGVIKLWKMEGWLCIREFRGHRPESYKML